MKRFVAKAEFAFSYALLEWTLGRATMLFRGTLSRRLDDAVAHYVERRIHECSASDESSLLNMRLHGPLALP